MASQHHAQEPEILPPSLSNDEQRIAQAIIAALSPRFKRIEDGIEEIKRDIKGINKVLSDNRLIIDLPPD